MSQPRLDPAVYERIHPLLIEVEGRGCCANKPGDFAMRIVILGEA